LPIAQKPQPQATAAKAPEWRRSTGFALPVSLSTPACLNPAAQQYTGFGTQETILTIPAHDKNDHIRETRNLPQPKGLIPGLAQALTGAKKRRATFARARQAEETRSLK
jgi:hypothetical protein